MKMYGPVLLLPLVLFPISFVASQTEDTLNLITTESSSDTAESSDTTNSSDISFVSLDLPNVRLREDDEEKGESTCMDLIGGYQKNLLYPEEFTDEQVRAQVAGTHIGFQLKPFYWDESEQYNGTIRGIIDKQNSGFLMAVPHQVCVKRCGTKPEYYSWEDIQESLANWILPILGIIVALPYESNKFFSSMLLMIRWLGNPITCFSIILWNLRVTAKCGKLVDMAESREHFDNFVANGGRDEAEPEKVDLEEQTTETVQVSQFEAPQRQPSIRTSDAEPVNASTEIRPSTPKSPQITPPATSSGEPYVGGNTLRNADGSTPGPSPPQKDSVEIDRLTSIRQSTQHAAMLQRQLTEQKQKVESTTLFTSIHDSFDAQAAKEDYGPFWNWALQLEAKLSQKIHQNHPPKPEEIPAQRKYPKTISEVRDSLYILSIINQFETDESIDEILWYALFTPNRTNTENITASFDVKDIDYVKTRTELAEYCRSDRKRGVVALMAAQLWFFISFGFNVAKAFVDSLGSNKASHALGMGIFLSWLPMLAIATIVDRNSVHTEEIRSKINLFLSQVREHRNQIETNPNRIISRSPKDNYYLQEFAGQGRRRFHYGVADKTLELLERRINYLQSERNDNDFSAGYRLIERGWSKFYESGELIDEEDFISGSRGIIRHIKDQPRALTVLGESLRRFRHHFRPPKEHRDLTLQNIDAQIAFDLEEFWQILLAAAMVLMPLWGGFTISYHTPAVGLSCRSGSYMIFNILVCFLFFIELGGWLPIFDKKKARRSHFALKFFISLFEFANFVFLVYVLTSLTVGAFNTCFCRSSMWGGARKTGYVVFTPEDDKWLMSRLFTITHWWIIAALLGAIPLVGGIVYAILEWCLQSHLWSADESKARHGLMMVRKWRGMTRWIYSGFMKLFVRLPYRIVMLRRLKYPFEWRSWKPVSQTRR